MQRILLALVSIAFLVSPSLAQDEQWLSSEVKTVTGTLDSFKPVMGRPPFWTFAKILVISETGEQVECFVSTKTVFTDADGKPMENFWSSPLNKGKKAELRYSTIVNGSSITVGANGAVSMHYLN
jgi:hypothetical protein